MTAIPETSTWVIGALALGAIGVMGRKRLRQTLKKLKFGNTEIGSSAFRQTLKR